MSKTLGIVAAMSALLLATPVAAQTSGSVAVGTDYMSRGTTQTFGEPAVMVYAEHQFENGLYVAGFVANIDFDNDEGEVLFGDDGAKLETDLFAGYRGSTSGINYDVGVAFIAYQGTKPTPLINPEGNWDMVEGYVRLSHTTGPVTLGTMLAVTPDYFNNYGPSIWIEGTVSYQVTEKLSASGAVGRQQFYEVSSTGFAAELSNYNTWHAGLTYSITPRLTADVRYHDNDTNIDLGPIYKPRVVATLTRYF